MPCNKAVFILSLDCEGKWGMADSIQPYHEQYFTTANINGAYTQMLAVLEKYKVPASFAFVSAFTQSSQQFKQHKDLFYNTPKTYHAWLKKFYQDMEAAQYEGWFCPSAMKRVIDAGIHEIASHSCFHRAFLEQELTLEEAKYDFQASQELLTVKPNTFIYPRNLVGFTGLLKKYGYIGYREGKAYKTNIVGRLGNLAAEFNILEKSQTTLAHDANNLAVIPAGFFLNWPQGLRKHVPNSVTQLRWNHILKHAVENNGVVHMWFHPHNFINHPVMVQNFAQIIEKVAQYREQGLLSVMTMQDYSDVKTSTL
jgi:peptidoglycan/xylan/chitin deacetylase (PgdA/CDA1 family)